MPVAIPPALAERLAQMEATLEPFEDFQLATEFTQLIGDPAALSDDERLGCIAEIEGMRFMTVRDKNQSPWQMFFSPFMSWTTGDGQQIHSPDASSIPREIIEYWNARSKTTPHPVLRARYADLALEIGRLWNYKNEKEAALDISRDVSQRAIDAHLETIEKQIFRINHQTWDFLYRAMDLALLIKDAGRIDRVIETAFAHAIRERASNDGFYWAHLDDMLWDRKGISVTEARRDEILAWLDEALAKYSNSNSEDFDPHRAQDAADRLVRWHENLRQPHLGTQAIKTAGLAFENAAANANALTAIAWLEDLSVRYRHAKLPQDVARVDATIKERSGEAQAEMTEHEVRVEITEDEMNQWLSAIFRKDLGHSLARISANLMRDEDKLRRMVEDSAKSAPLSSILSISLAGSNGFKRATVGSVMDDMSGRIMHTGATVISHSAPWLHIALEHAKEKWDLTVDSLFDWLTASPLFPHQSHALLREGIIAWFENDHTKSIHLLIPQVEAALREWMSLLGQSPIEPDHIAGGFQTMAMGKMLNHQIFREKMPSILRQHLRALFTDAKGLNVRNRIAHGLAGPEILNFGLANWVIHALMAIRTFAHLKQEDTSNQQSTGD